MDFYAVYKHTAQCEALVQQLRLRNVEWSVLFSFNEERSLHLIGRMFRLTLEELQPIIQRLVYHGLIEECEVSFEQYVRNTGQGPTADVESSLPEFLSQGKLPPPSDAAEPDAAPVPPASTPKPPSPATTSTFRLPPVPSARPAAAAPAASQPVAASKTPTAPVPHAPAAPAVATAPRTLYLARLINAIVEQAPSNTEGQLAVYRVFLRVPPELLKRNGIVSLSLVEDSTAITDPELLDALVRAVEKALNLSVPDDLFE